MNLIYFIRLLVKNAILIFSVAILMAGLVYFLSRDQPETFTSSTIIYTGIATGYDIESGANTRFDLFSNNAQFDNLINIIKSRETHERTAIRLMAQHLILDGPDPDYCLAETWSSLMSEIPQELKRMVDASYLAPPTEPEPVTVSERKDHESVSPDVTQQIQRYRVEKKYYTIRAGDSPSSVCQKFGLTLDQLHSLNNPMPPFFGGKRLVVGTVSEPWQADTVVQEKDGQPGNTLSDSFRQTPAPAEPAAGAKRTDPETGTGAGIVSPENLYRYNRLVAEMTRYKDSDQVNYLFNTLQSSNPYYSVQKIAEVKVTRIQSSDLLKLTYDSNDPAVCMHTLRILTDVFKTQYQSITATQTGMVSLYFQERVNAAKKQLDSLEQNLLEFRMKNRIINYDEQTKFISEQKELLDQDWYEEAGKVSAAKTALALVEENLGEKYRSVLQNNMLIEKRRQIYDLALQLSMEEIKAEPDIERLTRLKGQLERMKLDMNGELLKSFEINRSVQGLNVQDVLQKWFEKAIEVEESQARYNTLTERKNAFLRKYDEFAPLGSQLKKIDREIDLAQQDYMNHLNNLNISIMKQKNVEQSDIQIIDNPVYPIKPNASKRMITIIAAFMAGLVLTASFIILLEFLDSSIKFPNRFAGLSGLKLMGAFPRIPARPDSKVNYPLIASRAVDQIGQRIHLEELKPDQVPGQPFLLFFISTREKEGKTYLATRVVEKLRASGSKVLYVKPLEKSSGGEIQHRFISFGQPEQAWDFEYSIPDNFNSIRNINELVKNYTFLTQGYHYMVVELPALLSEGFPALFTRSGHLSVLVGRATRTWNTADEEVVKLYQSSNGHTTLALLNGCHPDQLESIIGEIPKRRSFIRKLVKRIINMDFHTKASFS
jgi:polysaccharide biosynthesis transport protein